MVLYINISSIAVYNLQLAIYVNTRFCNYTVSMCMNPYNIVPALTRYRYAVRTSNSKRSVIILYVFIGYFSVCSIKSMNKL